MATPAWNAGQAGLIGTAAAVAGNNQVNQLLGLHPQSVIYQGTAVLTPTGTGITPWALALDSVDADQPFTMSGTTIGRVTLPLLAVGNGADLLVSLCSDNSGTPGTMIVQTRIPASWVTQFSAVSGLPGPSSQAPITEYTGSPLATAVFNTIRLGPTVTSTWLAPYVNNASFGSPGTTWYDTGTGTAYLFIAGGYNTTTSVLTAATYTAVFDSEGQITASLPQPALPQPFSEAGLAVVAEAGSTSLTLVLAGGTVNGTITSVVYTASFDPVTGVISAWSAQTSLPFAMTSTPGMCIAGGNGYVYIVGAENSSAQPITTVYYAQVSNGQITAWNTTSAIPAYLFGSYATVINNQLWYFDGDGQVHYAPINTDGSLGAWVSGPTGNVTVAQTGLTAFGDSGFMNSEAEPFTALSTGPALDFSYEGGSAFTNYPVLGSCFSQAGQWMTVAANYTNGYAYGTAYLQPAISVPLPATGLTNGATYHVLIQQQGGTANDYLRVTTDVDVFPGNPTAFTSPSGAYTWTAQPSGTAVPMTVYSQSVTGPPLHTWEDSGARVTTLVNATTPDQRLLGIAEATRISIGRNQNQGFESGLSPWTVSGGSYALSTTQAREGIYSCQVTPSGSATNVYIGSERIACVPGLSVSVSGWFWFTASVTGNASMSVNWYTLAGAPISTSSNGVSVSAGSWTNLVNTFTAPASAYFYSLAPTLSGTPAASNIFYIDQVFSTDTVTPQQTSVVSFEYPGTWPGGTFPPSGMTALA